MHDKLVERYAYAVFVEHYFKLFVHFALDGENIAFITLCRKLQSDARRAERSHPVIAYRFGNAFNLYFGKLGFYYVFYSCKRFAVFNVDKRFCGSG